MKPVMSNNKIVEHSKCSQQCVSEISGKKSVINNNALELAYLMEIEFKVQMKNITNATHAKFK